MPKDTFFNLNDEKKRKIFDAAVQEFAIRRFSEASINQIIKAAGIPRGSFYQYFQDKEDLYLYMFTEIGKEKLEVIKREGFFSPDVDFFEANLSKMKILIEWSKTKPEYNQISVLMEMDDSEFIHKLRTISNDSFDRLRDMVERDKERGLIKPEVDSDLVVDITTALNMHLIKEYYRTGNAETLYKKLSDTLKIIKEGAEIKIKDEEGN